MTVVAKPHAETATEEAHYQEACKTYVLDLLPNIGTLNQTGNVIEDGNIQTGLLAIIDSLKPGVRQDMFGSAQPPADKVAAVNAEAYQRAQTYKIAGQTYDIPELLFQFTQSK
jgi:hypothetical protein